MCRLQSSVGEDMDVLNWMVTQISTGMGVSGPSVDIQVCGVKLCPEKALIGKEHGVDSTREAEVLPEQRRGPGCLRHHSWCLCKRYPGDA